MARADRASRFGDAQGFEELCKSNSVNKLKSYYAGEFVHTRMDKVREAIVYIRQNWDKYEGFVASLTELMARREIEEDVGEIFKKLEKNWADWPEPSSSNHSTDDETVCKTEYSVINLYTTSKGYGVFKIVNDIFRDQEVSEESIRCAVFLTELMNIDLYNLCMKHQRYNNFTGIVYRGMKMKEEDLISFKTLMGQPIGDRYISIPLGLWSTSADFSVAENFIKQSTDQTSAPLMFKVHVIELDPDLLAIYRKKYPKIRVSTICAVDIKELSEYQIESEILLRGAFFQVLNCYVEGEVLGKPLTYVEAVMLNSNRDHITTAFLGDKDGSARKMFGVSVGVTRNRFAAEYCDKHGLADDAKVYRQKLEEAEHALKLLIPQV